MKRAAAALAVFLVVSAAAPIAADELLTEIRGHASYPFHSSFDLVSDRNVISGFDFGAGWQFDGVPGLRTLVVFQTTAPGRLDSALFGGETQIEWGRQRVLGVLDFGVSPWVWFRPFVRGGLGYAHQFLAVHSAGPRLKDNAHDLAGFGSGGLNFEFPMSFGGFGVSSEVGYTFQTPATFDELRHDRKAFEEEFEDEEEGDPWTREHSSLGTLNTNGVFWDIGIHLRLAF